MTKKLCDIIRCDQTSILVEWLYNGQLRDTSIWTIREHGGSSADLADSVSQAIQRKVRFHWPNRDWANDIEWASRSWRGKHIVHIAYRALLASSVYHIWKERNLRRFENVERTPSTMALLIVDDIRQRIISTSLASSVSTRALYTLRCIPWLVE
ncbi:UNVERIFIED_CONTAM: hypothetical protein Sindi_0098600 [Sesamum indicum]